MKTVKFAQVLKFSENLVKVDKPEEERYVTVLLYGRGVIEREIKEGKVPVAFTGYKAHAGQLIISTINARNGAAGIIPTELEGSVVSKDFPLFDIDRECVDEQYLLYYLWSDSFIHEAEQNSFGATMPRLHVKPFLNMQMRLPTLSEQKRRAHTLCHVESLLNTQRHLLTKLDELVKSRFVEMFGELSINSMGWPMKPFAETCTLLTGNTPPRAVKEYYGSYIEWIKSDNITTSSLYLTKAAEYLSEEGAKVGRVVHTGTILMTCIAGSLNTVGNVAIVDRDVAFNQQINAFIPQQYETMFLYVLLQLLKPRLHEAASSALKCILNKGNLESYAAIVPDMELQRQFSAFVAEVDKSKLAVKQSLEKLETLKKSLMQEYFG